MNKRSPITVYTVIYINDSQQSMNILEIFNVYIYTYVMLPYIYLFGDEVGMFQDVGAGAGACLPPRIISKGKPAG